MLASKFVKELIVRQVQSMLVGTHRPNSIDPKIPYWNVNRQAKRLNQLQKAKQTKHNKQKKKIKKKSQKKENRES